MARTDSSTGGLAAADDPGRSALEWVRRSRAEEELLGELRRQVRWRWLARVALPVGLGAILALGVATWREDLAAPQAATTTVRGPEWRTLLDGSRVELRSGADITYRERPAERQVALRRGDAHFQVRPDGRAFVVTAGGLQIRAVGTAFAVALSTDAAEVIVTDGRVQVTTGRGAPEADGGGTGETELRTGHRAVWQAADGALRVETLDGAEIAARLAWRVPNLEFDRTPLPEVVDVMNRHGAERSGVFLTLGDPAVQEVVLTGGLRADDVDGLVRLLDSRFGVYAERSEDTVVLRRSP